jgi:hypothetical protein
MKSNGEIIASINMQGVIAAHRLYEIKNLEVALKGAIYDAELFRSIINQIQQNCISLSKLFGFDLDSRVDDINKRDAKKPTDFNILKICITDFSLSDIRECTILAYDFSERMLKNLANVKTATA